MVNEKVISLSLDSDWAGASAVISSCSNLSLSLFLGPHNCLLCLNTELTCTLGVDGQHQIKPRLSIYEKYSMEIWSNLAGGQDDAGQPAQEPPAGEGGDGGEGRRSEAHQGVGQRHVADKQVDAGVETGRPGENN